MKARDYKLANVNHVLFANNTSPSLQLHMGCNYSGNYVPVPPPLYVTGNTFRNNSNVVAEIKLLYCTRANISRNVFERNNPNRAYGVMKVVTEPTKGWYQFFVGHAEPGSV